MKSKKWDVPATDYSNTVLSVFENDTKEKIKSSVIEFGGSEKKAIDLGCGTGNFLPLLTDNFNETLACDYSKAMIKTAKLNNKNLNRLTFETCNLEKDLPSNYPFDFGLCVNVILTPKIQKREKIWTNLNRIISKGGHLTMVLPSLESALYSKNRLVEWNLKSGIPSKKILYDGFDCSDRNGKKIARGGIIKCGGIQTKHYLKEEIISTAHRFNFKIKNIQKIKYSWRTEFINPPSWMKKPYPWDWLVLLEK